MRRQPLAALAALAIVVTACGGSTTPSPTQAAPSASEPASSAAPSASEPASSTAPTAAASASTAGLSGAVPGPQAVVQSFYTWYIAEAQAGGAVNLRGRPDLTPAFVDWTEHYNDGQMFGADPVLCAQAIPESVTAGTAAISGAQATVIVTEVFVEPYRITVGLTLGSAGWQISTACTQASVVIRKPDGRIRLGATGYPGKVTTHRGPFVGNNVYNTTGARQTDIEQSYANTVVDAYYSFDISIQNDGTHADRFKVKATGTANFYPVKYLRGTTNITSAVVAGTYRTASLAPGATYLITAKVTEGGGNITRLVTITSVADATKKDAVKFGLKEIACGC